MSKTKSTAQRNKQLKTLKYRTVTEADIRDIPEVRDWDDAVRGRFYWPVKSDGTREAPCALIDYVVGCSPRMCCSA